MRARLNDPTWWTNALQIVKTVAAAVIAWVLAVYVFDIEQAFLAPWAALLTVHATVYRTFRRGAQQVGATVLGVLVAFALGSLLGLNALSLGLTILVALVAGSVRGLRAESTTAAATALVVLTTGASDEAGALLTRLADTGIGIAVGLLINLLVWPPLRDRSAAAHVDAIDDRLGELLSEIATTLRGSVSEEDVDGWTTRTSELDGDIERAWGVVRQARESGKLNPRRVARDRIRATEDYDGLLERLEQAVADTRSMARTIWLASVPPERWNPAFRTPWLDLLERAGAAVSDADPDELRAVREDLDALAGELSIARAAGRLLARRRRAARQPPQHPRVARRGRRRPARPGAGARAVGPALSSGHWRRRIRRRRLLRLDQLRQPQVELLPGEQRRSVAEELRGDGRRRVHLLLQRRRIDRHAEH